MGIPIAAAYAGANRVLRWSVSGFLIAALFMAAAAWVGVDFFLLRQVRRLVLTANRLRTGNLGARVLLPKSAGELGELGAAINAMAAALEERQGQLSEQRDAARHAEAQRHANETRLRQVIETMASGLLIADGAGQVTLVNSAAARMLRLPPSDLAGRSLSGPAWRRLRPDGSTMPAAESPFERVIQTREAVAGVEMLVLHAGGDRMILSVNAAPMLNADGTLGSVIASFSDITSVKATEQALRYGEQRFRSLVQHASDLVLVVEPDGVISYVSPSVERILGYPAAELTGASIFAQVHPDDLLAVQRSLADGIAVAQGSRVSLYRLRKSNGEWCALEVIGTNLQDDPAVAGYVLNARDVSERQVLEEELARQSLYDTLTGLPNRRLLNDRLALALARVSRRNSALAVLFLDVDGFMLINDSLGHAAGDALLVALGTRLVYTLRDEDTVARFGGDEFVILLEHMNSPADVDRAAERVIEALTKPLLVNGQEVVVNASIGIALSGSQLVTPEEIVRQADLALYQAKRAGKGRAKWFSAGMGTRAIERLDLDRDLRQAVNRNELVLHYQPEVNLRTGVVSGVEALLRWQHPTRGLIPPDAFIPIAEETGLILPIGQWVLAEACRQARLWELLRPEGPPLVMSVNISPREFEQPDLVARIERVLAETGVSPSSLCLEITENTLMGNAEATSQALAALRRLGVRVAIDDFGTGYSSLSYLQRFAVDTLKIDRSFVHKLPEDTGTFAIIKAVTSAAHALGMEVTAEGIETVAQIGETRRLLCDVGQGFHFSRPAPPDALAALLHPGYRAIMAPVLG